MTTTGPIAAARAAVLDDLRDASSLPVLAGIPERLEPPCIVITEGSPLIEPDDTTHAQAVVRFTANVIEAPTDNDLALARLDDHTDEVIQALWRDWMPTVEAYTTVTSADSQAYLAATIQLTTTIN